MIPNNRLGAAVHAYNKANPTSDLEARETGRSGVIALHGSNIPTEAELETAYAENAAVGAIAEAQAAGFDYSGTVYSATDNDMDRLFPLYLQFKEGFRPHPVEHTFSNGAVFTFDATNYAAFAQAFADFRNSLIAM